MTLTRTLLALLFPVGLLAACAAGLSARDTASLRVEGQRVSIVAPQGLCIDPSSPDVGRSGGFVLIGDCALFSNTPEAVSDMPGVMTVSVSTGGLPGGDLTALEAFLRGAGKAGLSRARNPESVVILDTRRTKNALFVKLRDSAPGPTPGAVPDYWRVFFPAAGRLVTGALIAFSDARIPDTRALALLSDLENRTTAANPVLPAQPLAPASEVTDPAPAG